MRFMDSIFSFGLRTVRLSVVVLFPLLFACVAGSVRADDGFRPLFNGVNLTGWVAAGGHGMDWRVEEGVIAVDRRGSEGARILHTHQTFRDFELKLEFKIGEGGNSGVFFRLDGQGHGLEIQLLDDGADRHANLQPWQYSGSLYGLDAPMVRASGRAGEWQSLHLRLAGQNLLVVLNNILIVESDLARHLADGAHENWHPLLERREGHIGLQNYGRPMRFRNIMIRELNVD